MDPVDSIFNDYSIIFILRNKSYFGLSNMIPKPKYFLKDLRYNFDICLNILKPAYKLYIVSILLNTCILQLRCQINAHKLQENYKY